MNIQVFEDTVKIPVKKAPAGKFAKILNGEYEGAIVKIPYCNNQPLVFLDRDIASSDRFYSMGDDTMCRVLQPGTQIIITL